MTETRALGKLLQRPRCGKVESSPFSRGELGVQCLLSQRVVEGVLVALAFLNQAGSSRLFKCIFYIDFCAARQPHQGVKHEGLSQHRGLAKDLLCPVSEPFHALYNDRPHAFGHFDPVEGAQNPTAPFFADVASFDQEPDKPLSEERVPLRLLVDHRDQLTGYLPFSEGGCDQFRGSFRVEATYRNAVDQVLAHEVAQG